MARIIVNAIMVRYPMGGLNQWILTWLVGMKRLGHDVYLVEDSEWENSCYDASRKIMTSDCSYGVSVINSLLKRYDLENNWCYIDEQDTYHGLSKKQLDEVFKSADVFVDFEWGHFFDRASEVPTRVFLDGEPGWFHVKLMRLLESGEKIRDYDYFFTDGLNIGTTASTAPTAGVAWHHVITPVLLEDGVTQEVNQEGIFTTVMSWQSHKPVTYQGKTYGQKDVEFERFIELPGLLDEPIEVAVSGRKGKVPRERLSRHGWRVRDAEALTVSVDSYRNYVAASKGQFAVAKNAFVQTQCGWFGDTPGYFLSYGKPVVLQHTGFSKHLPCGRGLFAVNNASEAAEAIASINADYRQHVKWARELAEEHLSTDKVIGRFLKELGI